MADGFNGFWCLEISEISERELSQKEKKKFNTIKLENKLIGKGYKSPSKNKVFSTRIL